MSGMQRRAKAVYKIPLGDIIDSQSSSTWTDPRSPSANVSRFEKTINTDCLILFYSILSRTPVNRQTCQLPTEPVSNNTSAHSPSWDSDHGICFFIFVYVESNQIKTANSLNTCCVDRRCRRFEEKKSDLSRRRTGTSFVHGLSRMNANGINQLFIKNRKECL